MLGSGRTVVVIEDDDSMREAIARLLDAAGFRCAAYASAEAYLAVSPGEGTACVVSDLKLPAMSGLDLLAAMRARGGRAPLILITAHDAPGLGDEAGRRGAAAYLAKPFAGTALLDAIRAAIEPAIPS
jgi:FixJ family two-component response regulator